MVLSTRKNRLVGLAVMVALALMVPLVAMQFTEEVGWSLGDFIFAGIILFGTGLVFELVAMRSSNFAYRAAVGVGVATGLMLVWVNGAVGIIGDEGNPANLLYLGVLQIGVIGAAIGRFNSRGMARALFATAFAQALVPVVALLAWRPTLHEPPGMIGVFVLNGFFVVLFVISGSLFRQANAMGPGKEPSR